MQQASLQKNQEISSKLQATLDNRIKQRLCFGVLLGCQWYPTDTDGNQTKLRLTTAHSDAASFVVVKKSLLRSTIATLYNIQYPTNELIFSLSSFPFYLHFELAPEHYHGATSECRMMITQQHFTLLHKHYL